MKTRAAVKRAKRIVVKVGSSTITRDGELRPRSFTALAAQLAELRAQKREVVLVSSGSIAAGSGVLGWNHPGRSIPEKQAAAAVGQIELMQLYRRRLNKFDIPVAQVLLTRDGLEERERFLNARHTLLQLLKLGVLPIVNENDTVSTAEIRFGDNDNLSAAIVNLIGADLLVILTDVEGLYSEPPQAGKPTPPLIDVVEQITAETERAAGGSDSAFGRGGMITKLEAAAVAAHSGAATILCRGNRKNVLVDVAAGKPVGTLFCAGERIASRKHWLAFTAKTRGELVLDDGAVTALVERGRSLLPAGIVEARGRFRIGDSVMCVDAQGKELARGLTAYAAEDVARICGLATREIRPVLGYSNGDAVIHRDDLVLVDNGTDS